MEKKESVDHFSHQHPLDPCHLEEEEKVMCAACEKRCRDQSYGCSECRFFLHEECAELPRELKHPMHSPHHLKLSDTANYLGAIYCDACMKRSRGFTFRCEECDFDLDIDCAQKAESEVKKKSIYHFSHKHVLSLEEDGIVPKEKDVVQEVWCKACEKRCSNPAYVCAPCEYFLHKSCAELSLELIHPLHSMHPLKLQITAYDGPVYCDSCYNKVLGFIYHCEQCNFDLDIECAQMRFSAAEKQINGFKHFKHSHTLVASEKNEDDKVLCVACWERCSGDTLGCEACEFFLHKSCAELPEVMNNPVHKVHPLKMQSAFSNICDNCDVKIRGFTYRCDQCDFDLDTKCAQQLDSNPNLSKIHERKKRDAVEKEMEHFAHTLHKLKRSLKQDEKRRCMACEKLCSGVVYGCDECVFFLHELCARLPRRFTHYFHKHVLELLSNRLEAPDQQKMDEPKMTCNACDKRCRGFTYSCLHCNFNMDVECTRMAQRKRRANYIEHFCHGHPLKILKEEKSELCSACKGQLSGDTYGCNKCRMWLHKSCVDALQENIDHFFHRHEGQKLLYLNTRVRNVKCKACRQECLGFTFHCEGCDFNLDTDCALMPSRMKNGHEFLGHGHPLKLVDKGGDTDIRCSVCEKRCHGSTYECDLCDFYIHKACGELPETITHDFHPKHYLKLITKDRFKCKACLKESSGFTYNCLLCPFFSFHVGCTGLKPIIEYGDHEHPLAFFESVYEQEKLVCNACKSEIPSSMEKQRDNVVRCVQCNNYNLHLLCSPLPCTIVSPKKHKHPLTLEDTFVEEDSDESYCDACEKERDPRECVYKCKQCPYVAAFDCMKSEVIELLQGKENHVKLRSLCGGIAGEVITDGIEATDTKRADGVKAEVPIENVVGLDDMLDSFIGDEVMNLTGRAEFLEKAMAELWDQIMSDIVPNVSSYTNEALEKLRTRLETSVLKAEFSMIFFEKEETEKVEEFWTFKSLVPTLKQLLQRHADVISRSEQSSESKSLILTMLCGAIRSMLELDGQIEGVSEALLFNWWNHFRLAECVGFEIQFLMDHLKRITLAYFALKAKEEDLAYFARKAEEQEVWEQKLEDLAVKIGESEHNL
ncbi:uncharacterized protein LOC116202699 [Punica granatum]|uniref:Phorbol-ester/DAG-type domain-containing protein n=2 Tax=Punica granatum TaxID=22663 RepID=A0A218XTI3_PUNGR|nr:uncharacterized protein LOC116202699 [Punica granatum]OWM88347.1 hypothetical protein CDL15_Pgr003759 [Punica granatum]PKI41526.1 hypothetical protein CRG98_038037 [Punica granatum]